MIFDLIFAFIAVGAFINGYKNGLVKTVVRTVFFIAGGVLAMHFVVEQNQMAKALKFTLIRGPLRIFDSLLGAALEVGKYVLLFYVIGTILLWAPWSTGQNAVAESKFYLQIDKHAPGVIADIRREVEKLLSNPRL